MIFDTTDNSEEQVLAWIEEKLIFPLISKGQVLLIFGGRRALFWNYFEVRRSSQDYELLPLTQKGSSDQLKLERQDQAIGKLFFALSMGHPEINWRILQGLRNEKKVAHLNGATIEANRKYVLGQVRDIIDSQFLNELSREGHELLWDVLVLRRFNTDQLRHFAIQKNKKNADRLEGDYLELIQQMLDAAVVRWDSDKGGYVLDTTIRNVMLENLWGREPVRFKELQNQALEMYQEWTQKHPDNRLDYIVEFVYHRSMLYQLSKPTPENHESFVRDFDRVRINPMGLPEDQLPRLLRQDQDVTRILRITDLQLLTDLLKRLSPKQVSAPKPE